MVEQPIRNRQVISSSLIVGSILSITYNHSSLHPEFVVMWIVRWIPLIDGFRNLNGTNNSDRLSASEGRLDGVAFLDFREAGFEAPRRSAAL